MLLVCCGSQAGRLTHISDITTAGDPILLSVDDVQRWPRLRINRCVAPLLFPILPLQLALHALAKCSCNQRCISVAGAVLLQLCSKERHNTVFFGICVDPARFCMYSRLTHLHNLHPFIVLHLLQKIGTLCQCIVWCAMTNPRPQCKP